MSEPNERDVAAALRAASPILLGSGPVAAPAVEPPDPDETWELPNGIAWVYYGDRGHAGLTRPVILADGFNSGPSTLKFSYSGLEQNGRYPLISELRKRGRDVILLGFTERSASILDNSHAARAAIMRAIAQRAGDEPLVVGGFSMGGLVTRHALAALETQGIDHQTATYFSYDSPHRGANIPISLQSFAHYIRDLDSRFSDQMNSPAAQQLLWRHIADWSDKPVMSELRVQFLEELRRVGDWPRRPRLLGLANGPGTGVGNGIGAGRTAVRGKGIGIFGTDLRTTPTGGDDLAAALRVVTVQKNEVHTPDLPDIDGAPGGTLAGFGILADGLNKIFGLGVENPIPEHCFVPAVSAVDVRNLDTHAELYTPIDELVPEESAFDDFVLASASEPHTQITEELCGWLLDRI
ncbi:hypothetical protein [Nocardia asteroides]|uniref:hypothetical protein n=1 Tax=Nocardia asteroides TaxID=1824 RepID=UPI001E31AA03|nr:hypothetical protein [Nocardia asteroides]UGT63049.1 hypothetical protein LTT61_06885 [Nocardia asteroides]